MTRSTTKTRHSPELARLLARHRREAERLRREFGDPEEALSAFVRETFDQEALEIVFNDMMAGATMWDTDHETGAR